VTQGASAEDLWIETAYARARLWAQVWNPMRRNARSSLDSDFVLELGNDGEDVVDELAARRGGI
jgi:hypothetical protein